MLGKWLKHPLTRGMDIDSPETTRLRKRIIEEKPFLRRMYEEWYSMMAASVPDGEGDVLELGSGAGFLKDFIPNLITSDIFPVPGVTRVVDAHDLPFPERSLRGIVMQNVLHHIANPRRFLREAARCVGPGGVVVMVEPWVTSWSRMMYRKLHHEPFEPQAAEWTISSAGPLSGANIALPWILFARDRAKLEEEFPEWQIHKVQPFMPFCYLLSGGVSLRNLMPAWTYPLCRLVEGALAPWRNSWSMFAHVVLVRTDAATTAARQSA